uniref:Uncharacterized protein n=1 Tax=Knipowitschia caucasica TaxID=637954 RepID=A0AAV2LPF4_KNICA
MCFAERRSPERAQLTLSGSGLHSGGELQRPVLLMLLRQVISATRAKERPTLHLSPAHSTTLRDTTGVEGKELCTLGNATNYGRSGALSA